MRLTNDMRDSIISSELAKKFHDDIIKLEHRVSVEIEKVIKKDIPKLPQKLIDDGYIKFCCEVDLGLNYKDMMAQGLVNSISSSYPIKANKYKHEVKVNAAIKKAGEKLSEKKKEKKEFKSELKAVLYSFTTDAKLLTHVPELKEYFKDADKAKNMAVVPVEQVNNVRKMLRAKK